jgi:hypothetical protein
VCLSWLWVFSQAAPKASTEPLPILFELLTHLGTGGPLSCERLRRTASAITQQQAGWLQRGLGDIASLGEHNFERDLHRWAHRQPWRQLLPELYTFDLPILTAAGPAVRKHAAFLPHEVFSSLFRNAPELFEFLLTGGQNNLESWWEEASQDRSTWHSSHPVVEAVPDARLRVPFGLHGDDAGMHQQQPVLCVTWNSCAVRRPVLDSRLVFSVLKLSDVLKDAKDSTLQKFYGVLVWSLKALSSGTFPACDDEGRPFDEHYHPSRAKLAGQPLAAGYVGAFAELRGDWKWLKESLYLEQSFAHNYVCHCCRAHRKITRLLFTDFSRTARHRKTLVTAEGWWAIYAAAALVSPFLFIPGFHIFRVLFDALHCYDLGIYQVTVPSALWELTEASAQVFAGATRAARFVSAYQDYNAWCKRARVKARIRREKWVPQLWRKTIRSFPAITQHVAKAAALRSMVYWMARKCKDLKRNPRDLIRAGMFCHFVQADVVCRRSGRHFTPEQRDRFAHHCERALVANHSLAHDALDEKLYKLLPKHHAATHVAFDSDLNPRRVQCYPDEDMIGRMKKIFSSCHGSTAHFRALERYAIMTCCRWWCELAKIRGAP